MRSTNLCRACALHAVQDTQDTQEVGTGGEEHVGRAPPPLTPGSPVLIEEALEPLNRLDAPPLVARGDAGLELEAGFARQGPREGVLR